MTQLLRTTSLWSRKQVLHGLLRTPPFYSPGLYSWPLRRDTAMFFLSVAMSRVEK